jgi:hypothetical protein
MRLPEDLITQHTIQPEEEGGFQIELVGEMARMIEVALDAELGSRSAESALNDAERRLY